jgi:hypothetical protein
MKWSEARDTIDAELSSLEKKGIFPVLAGEELFKLQAETRKVMNSAIHTFASKAEWPELSPAQQKMLYQRLVFGCRLARLMAGPRNQDSPWPVPESKETGQVIIEWLLRDAWEFYELPKHGEWADFSEN